MADPKRPSTASTVKLDDSLPDTAGEPDKATAELSAVVDELLSQLSAKFSNISSELLGKMDDMSRRLDNLEAAIQAQKPGDK
ncbi:hypothetical protein EJ06DRAFT_512956 [Trichodelitschia bisporula]|uniref:Heat shock factor binding protein 1 n=1 Tax=Trichodelitschia bisporula TaxID=703511 RepID=A0A6G1HRY9_9PEZI|nr:hypothetical protein EJ06DRAFT_512956 [Trichodelitschia bisporula]